MKKNTTILLLLLMALGIQAASKNGHFFKVLKNDNVSVENVEQCFDKWFSQPSGTEWRLVGEKTDQLGMQRIEYRQYVQGVEVEHSQVLLHVKDGKVKSANGTVMEVSQTPAKIKGGSTVYIGGTPTDLMGRKLYLVNTKDGYRYALKMLSIDGMKWVYTDAETGEVIKQIPTMHNIQKETTPGKPITVKGNGIFCGEVTLDASLSANEHNYLLYDQKRNIYTLNGAYLPTIEELLEMRKLFKYLPQGNLPSNYDEITEKMLLEWQKYLENSEDVDMDLTRYINDFSKLLMSSKAYFDAYTLTNITFKKLSYTNEFGEVVEVVPSPTDFFTTYKFVITYGLPDKNGDLSTGMIDEDNLFFGKLPYSTDEDFIKRYDEIPSAGATLVVTTTTPMKDENGKTILDEDGLPELGDYVVACVPIKPDETGKLEYNENGTEIEITYEKGPSAVVDIHWGMEKTLDFYNEVFNRDSYDDEGSPVYNLVFLNNDEEASTIIDSPLDNAAAMSGLTPNPMVYGMGDKTMTPCVELSMMAHEFSHLVTGSTAQLEYAGESGALNESFSDIMGISVKKYVKGDDTPWFIGGDGLIIGHSNMRDMAHPENSMDGDEPAPSTYCGESWVDTDDTSEGNDYGGVHTNSSVANKWYYLLTDGDEGVNDDGFEYDVKGIGIEKSRQIAYRALVYYATTESQYADFRMCALQAADDLYGEGEEKKSVADAWDAVGVYDDDVPPMLDGIARTVDNQQPGTVFYDLMGRIVDVPSKGVYIKNGKKYVVK
ncbi:MAG: M4 family metallopeptidase [Prevotella sp.]|nr:M4 family metallopeptidase [Prevotella sp.]